MEAKQRIRAVVRKAETKKSQQSGMQKAQGSFETYTPRSQLLSFNTAHILQRSY